jgi:putative PEP-CTERM system TPR-repeat lipoprotein
LIDLTGQAQLATNNKEGALDSYSKLVSLAPKSPTAHFRLAAAHMLNNNTSAAEQDLKKALALQPVYLDAQVLLAQILFKQGKGDAALAIVRQIQKTAGQGAVGHMLEGDILLSQKKPELAIDHYQKALSTAKTFPIFTKLHTTLVQNGKEKQADALFAQWLKENPDDLATAMYAGERALASNQFKEAGAQFEAILQRHPNNLAALNNLAWAYHKSADPRALATAEQAYKLGAGNAQIGDTLGWILVEQGNAARGVPLLQKALAMAPQDRSIRFHLAAGLAKAGEKAKAKKELEQILASGNDFAQIGEVRAMLKLL